MEADRHHSRILGVAARIADDVIAPAAADVDRRGRFPKEAFDALREARMLSLLVPADFGGQGASITEASEVVTRISRACGSTGLIYAMHLSQLLCVVRHGCSSFFRDYLRERVVGSQALLGSATTEANIGGDVRTSRCALLRSADKFRLEKTTPVISYGEHADAVLVTARRDADAPGSDQVLVLCEGPGLRLTPMREWDTMGFRGTCSNGFHLAADGPMEAVLPVPYAEVAEQTMVPISHILWSSVWLGMADEMVHQARVRVRNAARANPGVTPAGAVPLAELLALHQQLSALVRSSARTYAGLQNDDEALEDMEFALTMNGLKTASSTLVRDIACRALSICGLDGYREDAPTSLARIVRDALGASLMVSNDRILAHSAQMLLISKESE